MKLIKIIAGLISLVYLLMCVALYFKQKSLLFPARYSKPVAVDWQPHSKLSAEKVNLQGHCGQLQAAIWRVADAKGTIMMFHGNGESLSSIDDYAYAFTDLGYNLMAWDYAGYGQSADCNFSQADLLNDAKTAYTWLASIEKTEKIVLFGYSIGTGLALYTASLHPNTPLYLVAAYDSLLSVAQDKMPWFVPVKWLLRYPMATRDWVQASNQHVYILHGEADTLITPAHPKMLLANANANANGKASITFVAHAGHADDTLFLARNAWLKNLLP